MGSRYLRWMASLVLFSAVAASAEAQVAGGGMKLGFSGNGQFMEGGNTTLTNIIEVSYFSRLEGGAYITAFTSSSAASSDTSGFFFGTFKYNFIGESLFVPFLHAGFGLPLQTGASFNVLEYGGGFKAFFSERASFDVTGALQTLNFSGGDFSSGGSSSSFALRYGLSFYFGGNWTDSVKRSRAGIESRAVRSSTTATG